MFDAQELAEIVRRNALDPEAVESAAQIIVEEQRNYDSEAAIEYLEGHVRPACLRVVDTETLGPSEVTELVAQWLGRAGEA